MSTETKQSPRRPRERFRAQFLVRLKDAAQAIGLSESGVRAEIRAGRLEARRSGRAVLVPVEELQRWKDSLPAA